jgi:hypothetical protein
MIRSTSVFSEKSSVRKKSRVSFLSIVTGEEEETVQIYHSTSFSPSLQRRLQFPAQDIFTNSFQELHVAPHGLIVYKLQVILH